MFYSLTASGLNEKGAAQIRVELVKQLRAIANQPRHLTLESDAQFLANIGVQSPFQLLVNRQMGVLDRTRALKQHLNASDVRLDPALEAHEHDVLRGFQSLLSGGGTGAGKTEGHEGGDGGDDLNYACPDCGKSFPTSASLRQHRAKVHRSGENKADAEHFDRLLHGKDGMPQCVNCGHKFRLWEELQRHVQLGRCQAATRADYDEVKAPLLARVLDHDIQFPEVFFNAPGDDLRKELMEHCAICRSWFPNENYVKVHYARVHQDEWRAHHARIRVWCVTNLPKVKGMCSWCGHKAQQGRDHRATCPALFQLAMLWFIDGGPPRDDSNLPTTDVPYPAPADLEGFRDTCQLCAASLAKQRYRTHMQKQHKQLWHDLFPQVQMLCAAWEGSVQFPCQLCGAKTGKKAEHVHACVPLLQYALHHCVRSRDDGWRDLSLLSALSPGTGSGCGGQGGTIAEHGPGQRSEQEAASSGTTAQRTTATTMGTRRRQRARGPTTAGTSQSGPAGVGTDCGHTLSPNTSAGGRTTAAAHREAVPLAHGVGQPRHAGHFLANRSGLEGGQGQNATHGEVLLAGHANPLHDAGVEAETDHQWKQRLTTMTQSEETVKELVKHELVKADAGDVLWYYQTWNQTTQRLEIDQHKPPLTNTAVIQMATELNDLVHKEAENLIHRFHSTRKLTERVQGDTMPFILAVAMRGLAANRAFEILHVLEGNASLRVIGVRLRSERVQLQPLAQQLRKQTDAMLL